MSSSSVVTAVLLMVVMCSLHMYHTTIALPLPTNTGSGMGDAEPTSVDCTVPTTASAAELGPVRAGLQALRLYAGSKHSALQEVRCNPPVDFRPEGNSVKYDHYSAQQKSSGQPLADWFSVMVTFTQYVSSLENKPQIDNVTLQTLGHILSAVKQEMLATLQSLHCNCTSSCSIEPKAPFNTPSLINCQDPLNSVLRYLQIITHYADGALSLMVSYPSCTMSQVNKTDWIEDNIPSTSADYTTLLESVLNA